MPKDEKVKLLFCPRHARIYTGFYTHNTYTHLDIISLPQDDHHFAVWHPEMFLQVSRCLRQQDALRNTFMFPELPLRSSKNHHPAKSLKKKKKTFCGTKALTDCADESGNCRTEGPKEEEKGACHAVQVQRQQQDPSSPRNTLTRAR